MLESGSADLFDKIGTSAYLEFNEAADFIWKSPNFIKYETIIEQRNLTRYFPENKELQKQRWQLEANKLQKTFPYMIAVGNLFSVLSLFESYLLLLANNLKPYTRTCVDEQKGQGVNKLFNYFKSVGIAPSRVALYQQVDAAITIRNCLVHASGILSFSRSEAKLKELLKSKNYLSPDAKERRIKNEDTFDEISIVTSNFGDRIIISNKYTWLVCAYLSKYFFDLCNSVKEHVQNITL